jgi:hypothetical protein
MRFSKVHQPMLLKIKLTVYLLAISLPVAALVRAADVYQWTDSRGVIHFTDDLYAVPESIRRSEQLVTRKDFFADSEPSNEVKVPVAPVPALVPSQSKADSEPNPNPEPVSVTDSPQETTIVVVNSNSGARRVKSRACSLGQNCSFHHQFNRRQGLRPRLSNGSRPFVQR